MTDISSSSLSLSIISMIASLVVTSVFISDSWLAQTISPKEESDSDSDSDITEDSSSTPCPTLITTSSMLDSLSASFTTLGASLSDLSPELRISSSSSSIVITTSLRAATGVLQDSVEELVPSLAMKTPGVDSLEAVGSKDKLGLDGCEESEDSRVVCSDDVDG